MNIQHQNCHRPYQDRKERKRQPSRGVVAVEFALVLPFILIIFLGSIELANLNYVRNMANDAAFRVARALIVPGANSDQAIKKNTERLEKIGIKGASLDVRESAESVVVMIKIPISANSWAVGTVSNRNILETCILKKSFKSDD